MSQQERSELFGRKDEYRRDPEHFQQGQLQTQIQQKALRAHEDVHALRAAMESVSLGQATLQELESQKEKLARSETVMDSTQYVIDRSARVLRGMTLWGKVQNYFSEEPAVPGAIPENTGARDVGNLPPFVCPTCFHPCADEKELWDHDRSRHAAAGSGESGEVKRSGSVFAIPVEGASPEQRAVMEAQQKYVENLLPVVAEMGSLSSLLATSVESQMELVDNLAAKTERAEDSTSAVTRKASQLVQSKGKKAERVMGCALKHVQSGLFVGVYGEAITLRDTQMRNVCMWELHQRQPGIYGLRSCVSDLWLGLNLWGGVCAKAKSYGAWEEFQINLQRGLSGGEGTRLVACCANWSSGGYIVTDKCTTDGRTEYKLSVATCSPEDKARAAVFEIVDTEGYQSSTYATGNAVRMQAPVGRC